MVIASRIKIQRLVFNIKKYKIDESTKQKCDYSDNNKISNGYEDLNCFYYFTIQNTNENTPKFVSSIYISSQPNESKFPIYIEFNKIPFSNSIVIYI